MSANIDDRLDRVTSELHQITEEMRFDRSYKTYQVVEMYKLAGRVYRDVNRLLGNTVAERVEEHS